MVFSKIGTDFYLLKSSAIICLCLVLVNGNGSKTGHFGNGSRTGNFVLRVGGTGRRDILAKRNQGFNSVVGGQLTLPHDVSQLLKTHFHSGQLLPEPAFLLALAHTLPLHYYLLSCSNYCQRFYIISYLLLIYHTSLRTKLPSKYRSAITISSIPIRRYCSLFFSLLEMQPFVIGLVFLENVHVFPAAMVDAFASAIEKNEGRNRSDIIEFF